MGDLFTAVEAVQPTSAEDRLLEKVLDSGNIEVLERFLALRASEAERQARINFQRDFALMQQDLPPILKRKDNEGTKSKYAPMEDVQNGWNPTIKKWGFAYSWRTEPVEGKDGWTRTYLDIRKYGHTQTNFIDLPPLPPVVSREGNQVQNALQVVGGQASYGRRYSMIPGFGGVVEGEDSDGQIPDDPDLLEMDLQEWIKSGKIAPEACALITRALQTVDAEGNPIERNTERLKGLWKKARAKVGAK